MAANEPPAPPILGDTLDVALMERRDEHPPREPRRSASSSRHPSPLASSRVSLWPQHAQLHPRPDTSTASSSTKPLVGGVARRTLGIILLLITVFLWTASSFLASFIFADNTYSKPFFVTYVNTAVFAISLIPILLRRRHGGLYVVAQKLWSWWRGRTRRYSQLLRAEEAHLPLKADDADDEADRDGEEGENLLPGRASSSSPRLRPDGSTSRPSSRPRTASSCTSHHYALNMAETAKLSLEFCTLWFAANYFVAACLKYTTVASSTILTSTSSVFILLFGTLLRIDIFTYRKLIGVLASLTGIVLISSVDLSGAGNTDENRGSFPHKSPSQIALGDALAFLSAILYGFYAILMKKRIGDEGRVNMPLFFGLVGLFNFLLLWPGFILLHYWGDEQFALPETSRVWWIIIINSTTSLLSDFCWAYAMLLTSPLIVTVGLSLTIPLSLVGEMILRGESEGWVYWVGASVVFIGFVIVSWEPRDEGTAASEAGEEQMPQ